MCSPEQRGKRKKRRRNISRQPSKLWLSWLAHHQFLWETQSRQRGIGQKNRTILSWLILQGFLRSSGRFSTITSRALQALKHPEEKALPPEGQNWQSAVHRSEECPDLYIGETKQPLHNRIAEHRRANFSGQDSAVRLHLKDKGNNFEANNTQVWAREDRWFER